MIVGKTGSGKTEAWKCLQRALLRLKKEEPEDERFQRVHVHTINPLALSNDELYGCFEEATHEWQVGGGAQLLLTLVGQGWYASLWHPTIVITTMTAAPPTDSCSSR